MELSLLTNHSQLAQAQAAGALMKCNEFTQKYGLMLSPDQAVALVERRGKALSTSGRVEFGGGVTEKLIRAFCDSPFFGQYEYTDTIAALLDIFYTFKNETLDLITDDALIASMERAFNGSCSGSLELLEERELPLMAENLRRGLPPNAPEPAEKLDEDEVDPYGGA